MAETFFLSSLATYLGAAGLSPAPEQIGGAEPTDTDELPAIVLSLDTSLRVNPGLGERAQLITGGVLPWSATIDLANPFLPDEPTFSLLDATRRILILPHGGLVRSDGSDAGNAPLGAADITVRVNGAQRTVVAGAPGAGEVRAAGAIGTLTFGDALPLTGTVQVSYFLGQWEQRLERISGTLRVDVCADTAANALSLSDGVVDALLAPAAQRQVRRLIALSPVSVGSIAKPETSPALRRRTMRLSFTFEREVNRPDSSGGIITRIPVTSRMTDGGDPPAVLPLSIEEFTISA
ncbi:MAG TPA: hypothetical protein VIP11_13165 [Gemmatimonadaceae bacterium]